jgi:hypothetical protein
LIMNLKVGETKDLVVIHHIKLVHDSRIKTERRKAVIILVDWPYLSVSRLTITKISPRLSFWLARHCS